jgi:hypothetical protein
MDEAKIKFLFGSVPDGLDPDNVEDRAVLLRRGAQELDELLEALAREAVASQIAKNDPPEVWATAQRLTALGLDRHAALDQLMRACHQHIGELLATKRSFDRVAYAQALAQLPLADADDLALALLRVVRARPGIDLDEAERTAIEGLAGDPELLEEQLAEIGDSLIDDDGPLAWLWDDGAVHVDDLTAGIVLTHRLTDAERDSGRLSVESDLAGFVRRRGLRLADGTPVTVTVDSSGPSRTVGWQAGDWWLSDVDAGRVLAVRVDADGVVSLDVLDDGPAPDAELAAALRRGYDDAVGETGLPVELEHLLLHRLLADGQAFHAARPPLTELCAAAGLECRGHVVAHDDEVWAAQATQRQRIRVLRELERGASPAAVFDALDAAADPDTEPAALRAAMMGLHDARALRVAAEELFGADEDAEHLARTGQFAGRLLAAARRPAEVAVARWLAAVAAEREGEVHAAEQHVSAALAADPDWVPALERAAWYAADRGAAETAAGLSRRSGVDEGDDDLVMLARFAEPTGPKLGRNERCWCGSGRKYKACHLRIRQLPPLPERTEWLHHKATTYLLRRGGRARTDLLHLARARAVDPDDVDSVFDAFDDPIVTDAALVEGGWFERFLADRGPLLPEDEQLLAAAWGLVPRTVYEVVATGADGALTLRDLATGDRVEVRGEGRRRPVGTGELLCGRAVPDGGDSHRLIGAVIPVAPGRENDVLAMCEQGEGEALCDYVAGLHRPPTVRTREGEPLVTCTAEVVVPDPAQARAVLDRCYEPESDRWEETHELDGGERILRAVLRLTGDRVTISTHSEARMDRVLATLRAELPGSSVRQDERVPLAPGEVPTGWQLPGARPDDVDGGAGAAIPDEVYRQVRDAMEQRWISEPVPALAGLTPIAAAADPTRVDALRRLLATFPEPADHPQGALLLRPDRLRELLGLPTG